MRDTEYSGSWKRVAGAELPVWSETGDQIGRVAALGCHEVDLEAQRVALLERGVDLH